MNQALKTMGTLLETNSAAVLTEIKDLECQRYQAAQKLDQLVQELQIITDYLSLNIMQHERPDEFQQFASLPYFQECQKRAKMFHDESESPRIALNQLVPAEYVNQNTFYQAILPVLDALRHRYAHGFLTQDVLRQFLTSPLNAVDSLSKTDDVKLLSDHVLFCQSILSHLQRPYDDVDKNLPQHLRFLCRDEHVNP